MAQPTHPSQTELSNSGLYPWLRPLYKQITNQFTGRKLHHAMLIYGVSGLGKSQLTQRLAEFFQCRTPNQQQACGQCQSCLLHVANTHPDCYFIGAPADKVTISIDQIRKMQAAIIHTGLTNPIRVVVINDAQQMTLSAANALLKVLEEPPRDVYFLLTCSQRSLLPATVVSRCLALDGASVSVDKLANWVSQQAGLTVTPNQLALFNYSPLDAVAGVTDGQLDYISKLQEAMLAVVGDKSGDSAPLFPLFELIKSSDVSNERSISLIHLMIINWLKIASGINSHSGFELTAAQRELIVQMTPKSLLQLEHELVQLKQLCISQPATNKVLQLQRVIVEFITKR